MEISVKHKLINRLIAISLISQVVISQPVWVSSQREFPMAPVITGLNLETFEPILYTSLLLFLIFIILKPLKKIFIIASASITFILVLGDLTRLQPWVYLYILMLLGTVFNPEENQSKYALSTILMILGFTYFWGGIQKMNYFFGIEMFPWLTEFMGGTSYFRANPGYGYLVAMLEAFGGIALLFPFARKIGATVLLLMHLFILMALGPFGQNWNHVVWPWNICFAALIVVLTWFNSTQTVRPYAGSIYFYLVLLLVGALPLGGIFNKWDHFLSGGYYSAAVPESIFYFHENDRRRLPSSAHEFLYFKEGTEEEFVLLDIWALNELNVPLYPEERIQITIGKQLCDCVSHPENAGIRINTKLRFEAKSETIEIPCTDMGKNLAIN